MATNYLNPGDVIQWKNETGATVASGQLVKVGGGTLGVALVALAINETGSVAIEGVFSGMPKVTAAVFAQGEKLLFDVSADSGKGQLDDSAAVGASGDVMGGCIAWAAGANLETTCTIKLTPGNSTVTA